MADFRSLAEGYILTDNPERKQEIASKAAKEIQDAASQTAAILSWAQSINQWMPTSKTTAYTTTEESDGGNGSPDEDLVSRAEALGFLADTLGNLDGSLLKANQVEHLIAFFGAMFDVDHKAGITAAVRALAHLTAMRNFKAGMGPTILRNISRLGDDFRLQRPTTRLAIYTLTDDLLRDENVRSHLQHSDGASSGFMIDLLSLCRHERDPANLMAWFRIIRLFLSEYSVSADVAKEVFNAYAGYFPISLRTSAAPGDVTADDLKLALRECFAANHIAADYSFDFLLQKLDQGDSVTTAVRLDTLATLKSCIEAFPRPTQSVVPHASRIWNSLKFEVRNGEAAEAIEAALASITALSSRLDGYPAERLDGVFVKDFVQLSMGDCTDALASPAYAKSTGRLVTSVARGSMRAFNLVVPTALDVVRSRLRDTKDILYVRDLIWIVSSLLETRYHLMQVHDGDDSGPAREEFHRLDPLVSETLESIYLPLCDPDRSNEPGADEIAVLKEVMKGLGELVRQRGRGTSSEQTPLCAHAQTDRILTVLVNRIVYPFQSSLEPDAQAFGELAGEVSRILRSTIRYHPPGFDYLVQAALSSIRGVSGRSAPLADGAQGETTVSLSVWRDPTPKQLMMLKDMLSRVAFIGCSTVVPGSNPLRNLVLLISTLLRELFRFFDEHCSFRASTIVLSGIYAAMLNFRDACLNVGLLEPRGGKTSMPRNWVDQFSALDLDTPPAPGWTHVEEADLPTTAQAQPIFEGYLGIGLDVVARLYRRATIDVTSEDGVSEKDISSDFSTHSADPGSGGADQQRDFEPRRGGADTTDPVLNHQDKYLHQLANVAAFVVRDLDESEQHRLDLHKEPFALFRSCPLRPTMFHHRQKGRLDVLSKGVLQGLHPAAVARISDIGLAPIDLIEDIEVIDQLPERSRYVRNCIATLICNKSRIPGGGAWSSVISRLSAELSSGQSGGLKPDTFSRIVAVASGAIARLDGAVKSLAGPLSLAPADCSRGADQMARSLATMVSTKDYLTAENHAIIKPIYRQWVYTQIAQPLIPRAFPFSQDTPRSSVFAITVLAVIEELPLAIYSDDVEAVTRILIAAMSVPIGWRDTSTVFRVLTTVIENRIDALRDHLKAVVDGIVKVLTRAWEPAHGPSDVPARQDELVACRRQAVVLLSLLPSKFDPRYLLPYQPSMLRLLSTACGDRYRQVREAAQVSRESWIGITWDGT